MDQTKYINAYIDIAMSTIHESTAQLLQLKTQNRIANDLLTEKDNIIANLSTEVENLRNGINDMNSLRSQNDDLRQQHTGIVNKLAHFETMSNQVVQMKHEILTRNNKIRELEEQISAINKRKVKSKSIVISEPQVVKKAETDDF